MKRIIAIIIPVLFLSACLPQQEQAPAELSSDTILDDQLFQDGVDNMDSAKCDQILDQTKKDECKKTVEALLMSEEAYEKMDKSLCKGIKLSRYKDNCETDIDSLMEEEKNDENELAEKAKKDETRLAIEKEAVEKEDADICDAIEEGNHMYTCRYNVISAKATKEKDPKICEEIGEEELIETCKSFLPSD